MVDATSTTHRRRPTVSATANIVVIIALIAVPLVFEPFQVTRFTQILVVTLAVLGLNLLTGFTGQVSVGHSAFFGVGAYTAGILLVDTSVGMLPAVLIGTLAGAVLGALVGIPSLRIKGTSLAIVTLVLAAAFPSVVRTLDEVTGGTQGLRVPRISSPSGSFLADDQLRYFVVLLAVVICAGAVLLLDRARVGRALRALGDHEMAAITLGIRPSRLRVGVFTASAAITALAGALFVITTGFISSSTSFVTILGSIAFLTALVIGGRAILLGPLIGSLIVELVPAQIGQTSPEWAFLVYGAILVIILLVAPSGLTGIRQWAWLQNLIRRNHRTPTTKKKEYTS